MLLISLVFCVPISAAENIQYGLVDTLTDGKEYVIIFNSSRYDNTGERHPVYLGAKDKFGSSVISKSKFKGDNLELDSGYSSYVWIAEKTAKGGCWRFKSAASGFYLSHNEDLEYGITISENADDSSTLWSFKKHTNGYCLHPYDNNNLRIYYDEDTGFLELGNESSRCYTYLYERGATACYEHVYDGCLDYTCNVCQRVSRKKDSVSHVYKDDPATCDECGFIRKLFEPTELSDNTAQAVLMAYFEGSSSTRLSDRHKDQFEITSLIAGVAPLEFVSHIDLTIEANRVISSSDKAQPSCSVSLSGGEESLKEALKFNSIETLNFSLDLPKDTDEIWVTLSNFAPNEEFLFRITAEVTYSGYTLPDFGEKRASVITFSDYQLGSGSQPYDTDWIGLSTRLRHLLWAAGNKADPDYVIFGGDHTVAEDSIFASNMGRASILSVVTDRFPEIDGENGRYIQIQGNHDPDEFDGYVPSGATEGENVIIYSINHQDFSCWMGSESSLEKVTETATALEDYLKEKIKEGERRPIIIATHVHLHYDPMRPTGITQYAYVLFDVINEAAEKLDIIYLFGHNHSSGDPEVGGGVVYRGVGETINVCDPSCYDEEGHGYQDKAGYGRTSELNFTYMNHGYVGYIIDSKLKDVPAFSGVKIDTTQTVSEIAVYDDVISINKYSLDGRVEEYARVIERAHKDNKPIILPQILLILGGALIVAAIVLVIILSTRNRKNGV